MTKEELALLRKAAADPKGQIALKRDPDGLGIAAEPISRPCLIGGMCWRSAKA
jgi:hypothetical protein